jgi:outer membrane protein TolC
MKWMFKFKSLLLVFLALLLTACQTSNTQQLEDKFATFERSALPALQQSLDSDLKFESVPTAVEDTDAPGVAVTSIADAQQLALLHSERVAGILLEQGIHEATAVQKQLLENPGIGLSMMRPEDGGRWKMELSLSLGLVDWLSRQQRQALSASEIALWQLQAWQRLSDELTQVANQWLQAVAAQQKLQAHRELYESAVVAADFAQLLFDAGNISELELLGSQSIVTQRQAQQINAELDAAKKASMIKMSLGLSHETAIIIPDQLPMIDQTLLIAPALETQELLQLAQQHQPALLLTNRETQRSQLELATAVRRINLRQSGLELMSERESNGERQQGLALSLAAPVFDNGDIELSALQGRVQLSLNHHQQQLQQTGALIQNALSDINSNLQQIDLLTQKELPLYQRMMTLSLQEYNFMLRGTFELFTVAVRVLDARLRYIDASEHYWRAWATLGNLVGTQIQESEND